jgi:hypothetical protein
VLAQIQGENGAEDGGKGPLSGTRRDSMFTSFAWLLFLSLFDIVEASIDPSVYPNERDTWNRIGLFVLKDGDKDRIVLLYCYDSDSAAEKRTAKNRFGMRFYPNIFDVHAIYQDRSGTWKHQEVFGYARVRFMKVEKVAPDHLILQCRPNFLVRLESGEDIDKAVKRGAEINQPFTRRIEFFEGKLTAKKQTP